MCRSMGSNRDPGLMALIVHCSINVSVQWFESRDFPAKFMLNRNMYSFLRNDRHMVSVVNIMKCVHVMRITTCFKLNK